MHNRGFTLMETIIYIGLFGVLMSGAVVGTYNLMTTGAKNVDAAAIQEEGTFLDRKINWALSSATAVTVLGGGSKISITRPDLGAQSPLLIEGASNVMTLSRGGAVPVQLNSDRYPVTGVQFVYQGASGSRPPSVTTQFSVGGMPFTFRTYLRQ